MYTQVSIIAGFMALSATQKIVTLSSVRQMLTINLAGIKGCYLTEFTDQFSTKFTLRTAAFSFAADLV